MKKDIAGDPDYVRRVLGFKVIEMTEHKTLHEAMLAIQQELKDPTKGSVNPHFKSHYADLKAVCDCIRPVAHKHGVYFNQGGTYEGAQWAIVTQVIHSASGERQQFWFPLGDPNQKIQELCGRITYLRRYALVAAFGLAPEDEDDDGETASGRGKAAASPGRQKRQAASADRDRVLGEIGGKMKALGLKPEDIHDLTEEAGLGKVDSRTASKETLDKILALLEREEELRKAKV